MFAGYLPSDDYPLVNLEGVGEDYASSFLKQFLGLKYLVENCPADFYLFGGTDNYFVVDRLLDYLQEFNPEEKWYIGGHGYLRLFEQNNELYFHSGGAGFILSRALARQLYEASIFSREIEDDFKKILQHAAWCRGIQFEVLPCDVAIAYYIQRLNTDFSSLTIKDNRFKGCSCYGTSHNDTVQCCDRNTSISEWDALFTCHYMESWSIRHYHTYLYPGEAENSDSLNDWTLVTAFFNTQKYLAEDEHQQPSEDSEYVMSLNVNLVIYCDPEFAEFFREKRAKHHLTAKTKIVSFSLDQSKFYSYQEKIIHNRSHTNSSREEGNSYLHLIAGSTKFEVVQDAIEKDYFRVGDAHDRSYFGWIDIGICKTNGSHRGEIYRALNQRRQKCSFCYIDYTPRGVMKNLDRYYNCGRCGTACGFFTGERAYLSKLCEVFGQEFEKTVEAGYGHAEEQIIPPLYLEYRELFDFYYGDYHLLFSNYDYIRREPSAVLNRIIVKARLDGHHQLQLDAGWKLWTSIRAGHCQLELPQLLQLADEIVIAAFYLQDTHKPVSVFQDLQGIHQRDPVAFQAALNPLADHMISNTDFYWPRVSTGKKIVEFHLASVTPQDVQDLKAAYSQREDVVAILYTADKSYTLDSFCFYPFIIRGETHPRLHVPPSQKVDPLPLQNVLSRTPEEQTSPNKKSARDRCTIVSVFVNLEPYQPQQRSRGTNFYMRHARHLLSISQPMILFIDPQYVEDVRQQREKYCPQKEFVDQTSIIPFSLSDSPYFKYLPSIQEVYPQSWLSYLDRANDTPAYVALVWSKTYFLHRACQDNPWLTERFSWIDFGIFYLPKIVDHPLTHLRHLEKTLQVAPADKITCLAIHGVYPAEVKDRRKFYSQWNARTAGGFICGGERVLSKLHEYFQAEVEWCRKNKIFPLEEPILSVIRAQHPSLFDVYYGDYNDILSGYESYTCYGPMGPELAFHQFELCQRVHNWRELAVIAERVWTARTRFPPASHSRILNNLLQAYKHLRAEAQLEEVYKRQYHLLFPAAPPKGASVWAAVAIAVWYRQQSSSTTDKEKQWVFKALEGFSAIADHPHIPFELIKMYLDVQDYDNARILFDRLPTLPANFDHDPVQRECFQFIENYEKLKDLRACDKTLLNKASPTALVLQARQTIFKHLQPLESSQVVDLSKLCRLPTIPGYPDTHYQPLNPNIVFDSQKREFKVLCRTVNYLQDTTTGIYTIYDPQNIIRTRNLMMSFNTHLQLLKVHEVIDDCKEIRRYPSFARGLEDMRLLWKEGQLIFSATTIETSPTSNPTIAMGIIDMEPTQNKKKERDSTQGENGENPNRESTKSPNRESMESPHRESTKSPNRESMESPHRESTKSPNRESTESPHRESEDIETQNT
jgi:hypothetical protein